VAIEDDEKDIDLIDKELALAFRAGDEEAFVELVRMYQGRVYAVAYRIVLNHEDARDVAQEAFVKAHRKIKGWQPTSGFLPWILRIASNQAIDYVRRKKRHKQTALDDAFGVGEPPSDAPSMDTEAQVRAGEIEARVQQALIKLSPSQRTAFILRHYEQVPLAEIAPVLGCSVGSVKVHLFRALQKLREELADLHE